MNSKGNFRRQPYLKEKFSRVYNDYPQNHITDFSRTNDLMPKDANRRVPISTKF